MTSDTQYIRMLTLEDADFYAGELKALQALEDNRAAKTIADICRDFNLDQYDFKDRWGSLLRHNRPGILVEKIQNIRAKIGTPIHDIAREFNYTIGTVRNILRKLLVKPENTHNRSKENRAHRLMNKNGGSLKEAIAVIGPRRKYSRSKPTRSNEDSLSSSPTESESEEEKPLPGLKAPKVSVKTEDMPRVAPVKKDPVRENSPAKTESIPVPVKSEPLIEKTKVESADKSLFEAVLGLLEDIPVWLSEDMQLYLSPRAQIQVLFKQNEDYQAGCTLFSVDYTLFHKLWKPVVSTISKNILASVVYLTVILTRLGYGYRPIAEAIGCSKAVIAAISWNLRLYAGPSSGRSFDVALSLLHKCPLKSSKVAEMCAVPVSLIHHIINRASRKDSVKQQLQARLGDTAARVMWVYERGVPLGVIATALGVSIEEMRNAGAEDST